MEETMMLAPLTILGEQNNSMDSIWPIDQYNITD
jgi:hypothetical protein